MLFVLLACCARLGGYCAWRLHPVVCTWGGVHCSQQLALKVEEKSQFLLINVCQLVIAGFHGGSSKSSVVHGVQWDFLCRAVANTPVFGPLVGRALLNVHLRVVSSVGWSGSAAAALMFVK